MKWKLLLLAFCAALLAAIPWAVMERQECPSVEALLTYRPAEATRVYAGDGSLLADLSPERRVVIDLDDMPPTVSNGFVAVEDRRFWQHEGVDLRGVARAVWRNVTSLSLSEGFSTITMQLTRNVFPDELPRSEKLRRKVCEIRLAGDIEDELTKRDILVKYINQVYFGDGKYGIEEAARGYFGKSAKRLSVSEAATLVGLVKNPEGYNPRRHPGRAVARRNVVLDVLVRENVVSAQEAERARADSLVIAPPLEASGAAPYYVAAVRRELRERFGDDAAVRGLRVHTGLDPALQQAAHKALVTQIERIEAGTYGRWKHPKPAAGQRPDPAQGSGSPYLQGMVIVLDSRTGAVRALVGGRDFTHSSFDRALHARRQPGSTFKPIVYATALELGMSPAARIETTPVEAGLAGAAWRPDDLVPDSVTVLSMRDALVLSSNNGAVRVGEWAGLERVTRMARRLGLSTDVPEYPSVLLGSAEVIPAELTAAYAALGNGGYRVVPHLITRVEDAHGRVLWSAPEHGERAMDSSVAYLTTSLLEDVVDRGTGTAVRKAGFWLPAAGKTGTTNDAKDVWFVGMTPDLAAGVWIGFDRPAQILPAAFGGTLAAPVWAATMKAAYETRPAPAAWSPPSTLVSAPVDVGSGRLATPACPPEDVRIEHFAFGTEPGDYCDLHPHGVMDRVLRGLRIRGN